MRDEGVIRKGLLKKEEKPVIELTSDEYALMFHELLDSFYKKKQKNKYSFSSQAVTASGGIVTTDKPAVCIGWFKPNTYKTLVNDKFVDNSMEIVADCYGRPITDVNAGAPPAFTQLITYPFGQLPYANSAFVPDTLYDAYFCAFQSTSHRNTFPFDVVMVFITLND